MQCYAPIEATPQIESVALIDGIDALSNPGAMYRNGLTGCEWVRRWWQRAGASQIRPSTVEELREFIRDPRSQKTKGFVGQSREEDIRVIQYAAASADMRLYIGSLESLILPNEDPADNNVERVFSAIPDNTTVLVVDYSNDTEDERLFPGIALKRLATLQNGVIVIGGTNRPDWFDTGIWQQLRNLLNVHFPSLGMRQYLWRIFLVQGQRGWSGAFRMLAEMSNGLGGMDIMRISQSSRQCSFALGKGNPMPLASILLAVANSSRGNCSRVHTNQLDGLERKAVRGFLRGKGVSQDKIDEMLKFASGALC